ncbi:hypothetical protein NDU88_003898 [Pleurodeles waltl]|uniref:Uncharacterized protein n=1 Tax=Pleurodeles waltl TaxID=8319 RepID=A0AAV7TQX2_PLEWA|nr:hypothetical protein NDU88_003898 [Pleurodeles waltl]
MLQAVQFFSREHTAPLTATAPPVVLVTRKCAACVTKRNWAARAAQVCRLCPEVKLDCRVLPPGEGRPRSAAKSQPCLKPKSRPTTD